MRSVIKLLDLSVLLAHIQVLPTLLKDLIHTTDGWGNGGQIGSIDPFVEICDVRLFHGGCVIFFIPC